MNAFVDYPRIASTLFCEPWLILPEHHANVAAQFQQAAHGSRPAPLPSRPEGNLNAITSFDTASRIGTIRIEGILGKGLPRLAMECGGVCLEVVEDGLNRLWSLRPVAVVVIINSPGGASVGVEECAEMIEEFSAYVCPTWGFTDRLCAAAGLWLAASCNHLHAAPSSELGGIGAHAVIYDESRRYEEAGVEVTVVASGALKGSGVTGAAVTDAHRADVRGRVSSLGAEFQAHMRRRRPKVRPDTHFTGGTWAAKEPEAAALHDGLIATRAKHLQFVTHQATV